MTTRPIVSDTNSLDKALKERVRKIELRPPTGKSRADFLAELVAHAKKFHLKGYDVYEAEAIIREMAE